MAGRSRSRQSRHESSAGSAGRPSRSVKIGVTVAVVGLLAVGVAAARLWSGRTVADAGPSSAPPQAAAASQSQASTGAFDSARAWAHLREIVAIGPRPSGSAQIRQTRAYITRQMSALGLTVQEQPFTATTPLGRVEMANLIVRLPGKRSDRILLTGHYDTKLFKDQVFVGANDGGSSAAFLLELARVLKDRPREFTYELVWFDGEEAVVDWHHPSGTDNTYGSRYYVQAAREAKALASVRALVLVDMIGEREVKIRREAQSTAWLANLVWAAARRVNHGSTFVEESAGEIADDHVPFLAAGVPAVDIIDLDYLQWHNQVCCDTLDHVSARSLQIVGDVVLAALPDIEAHLLKSN